jgi:acetyltransferase
VSIRNLDRLFRPRSVALIGASEREGSVGQVVTRNLLQGGFKGRIFPVNPRSREIAGKPAFPDVESLPEPPDLGVICTPPETVPALIAALGARGAKGAVVITAGFAEMGEAGRKLQEELLRAARPHLLRVVGPNCLGILVPEVGLNASFAHLSPPAGGVAFATQSGAMVAAVLDWAAPRGIGFSHLVSMGGMADVDFGDMLDYLAGDPGTRAILLYIEGITAPRKFMSAARAAARSKPVLVIKAGRFAEGARAVRSHTGALAGSDAVYEAAFRRAGMLRVEGLEDMFDAIETLALAGPLRGDRLAILTNGGGIGVLATDSLIAARGRLATLSPATIAALDRVLPKTWSRGNPVDIIGDARGERYEAALAALLAEPEADAILILNCPTAIASSTEAAQAVVRTLARTATRPPVLASWVGGSAVLEGRGLLQQARIPNYDTPGKAVRAFQHMIEHKRAQAALMETPPSGQPGAAIDRARAGAIVRDARDAGREWLTEVEAKALIAAYGIPVVPTRLARNEAEAAHAAEAIGAAVVLKILSPDITHKSDVGGVALGLDGPERVRAAAAAMRARIAQLAPAAKLEGFTVQPMIARPRAFELILGLVTDPQFGPVVLFGQGGTAVELIEDKSLELPPLNLGLAQALIARTRIARLLKGYRGRPPAKLDAIAAALLALSQLAVDFAEIAEIDINPLLADENGVVALDARVRIAPARGLPEARLAIRPYPRELESVIRLPAGENVAIRPIRPEDEPALRAAFDRLDEETVRLRFHAPIRALSREFAARLTQIDYDREMALIALAQAPRSQELLAVVRLVADPDNEAGEFAITVGNPMRRRGLGEALLRRILDYGKRRGLKRVFGEVLRENAAMLGLARKLGFRLEPGEQPSTVRAVISL